MQIYAHRAGRGLAPENTMFASQTSISLGVDVIDFDVAMTRDGDLVVTHDLLLNPDITRDSSGVFIREPLPIYQMSYSQLATYNVGQINPNSAYAKYFPKQKQLPFAAIPLLREAIDEALRLSGGSIRFQIEIKIDPLRPDLTCSADQFAKVLYQVLKEKEVLSKTEVQSFDYHTLLALQKIDSQIFTAYLTSFDDEKEQWILGHEPEKFGYSFPKMIASLGGKCWGPCQTKIAQEDIEEAKTCGLKVVPWCYPEKEGTEFNIQQIAKLLAWDVDGIITDRPDILKKMIIT